MGHLMGHCEGGLAACDKLQRAMGEVIQALDSPNDRRREWAAEKIMSSYLARNDPFAPARRGGARSQANEAASTSSIVFKWAGAGGVTPLAAETEAAPISPPPELPRWAGLHPPPPLVAGKYQPWEAPVRR